MIHMKMKIGLAVCAALMLLAVAPASAQVGGYQASASASAKCFDHNGHWASVAQASASAGKSGVYLPGELYYAEVQGTGFADAYAGPRGASASGYWGSDVSAGHEAYAEAFAQATLAGTPMATAADADKSICPNWDPPSQVQVDLPSTPLDGILQRH